MLAHRSTSLLAHHVIEQIERRLVKSNHVGESEERFRAPVTAEDTLEAAHQWDDPRGTGPRVGE